MNENNFTISEAAKQLHVEAHVLRYWEEELGLHIDRTENGHRYYTKDDIQLFHCIKKLKNEGVLLRELKPLIPELTTIRRRKAELHTTDHVVQATADSGADSAPDSVAKMPMTGALQATSKPAPGSTPESVPGSAPEMPTTGAPQTTTDPTPDSAPGSIPEMPTTGAPQATPDLAPGAPQEIPGPTTQPVPGTSPETASTGVTAAEAVSTGVTTPKTASTGVTAAEVIEVTRLEQVRSLFGEVVNEIVTANNRTLERNISRRVTSGVCREMELHFQIREQQEEEHFRKLDNLIRQQQIYRREAAEVTPLGALKKLFT